MSKDRSSVSREELTTGAVLAHHLMMRAEKLNSKQDLSFALAQSNSQEPKNAITHLRERSRELLHEEFAQLIEQAQTAFAFTLVGENTAPQEQLKQLVEYLSQLIIDILETWVFLSETNALVMIQELQQLGATKPLGIELSDATVATAEARNPENVPAHSELTIQLMERAQTLGTTPGEMNHEILAYLAEQSSKENPQTIAQIAAGIDGKLKNRKETKITLAKAIRNMLGRGNSSKKKIDNLLMSAGLRIISEKVRKQGNTQKNEVLRYYLELVENIATNSEETQVEEVEKPTIRQQVIDAFINLSNGEYLTRAQLVELTGSSEAGMSNAILHAQHFFEKKEMTISAKTAEELGYSGKLKYYYIKNLGMDSAAPVEDDTDVNTPLNTSAATETE